MKTKKPEVPPGVELIKLMGRWHSRIDAIVRILKSSEWKGASIVALNSNVIIAKDTATIHLPFPDPEAARDAVRDVLAALELARGSTGHSRKVADGPVHPKALYVRPAPVKEITWDDVQERRFSADHEERGLVDDSGPEMRGDGKYPEVNGV